jgi:hypothetical protein
LGQSVAFTFHFSFSMLLGAALPAGGTLTNQRALENNADLHGGQCRGAEIGRSLTRGHTPLIVASAAEAATKREGFGGRALSAVSFERSALGVIFVTSPRFAEKLRIRIYPRPARVWDPILIKSWSLY